MEHYTGPVGTPYPTGGTMDDSQSHRDGPRTTAEFQARLKKTIQSAHANGIDIKGGWDCRAPPNEQPDWTVEITEVQRTEDKHRPD